MKKLAKIFIAISIFFNICGTTAQTMDSVYYVRIISKEDLGPLPFTTIEANGIWQGETDRNGIVKLYRENLNRYSAKRNSLRLEASALGFKKLKFSEDTLVLHDTLELALEKNPIILKEVKIITYKVPLIEPKYSKKKKKENDKVKDTAISYSEKELRDYVLIIRNEWPVVDSLRNKTGANPNEWHNHLSEHLDYPEKARKWDIEEKVYFSFEIDDQGYLQNIKLLKDCNPILAIAVMDQLMKTPRLLRNKEFNPPPRPLEYQLIVSFMIRD